MCNWRGLVDARVCNRLRLRCASAIIYFDRQLSKPGFCYCILTLVAWKFFRCDADPCWPRKLRQSGPVSLGCCSRDDSASTCVFSKSSSPIRILPGYLLLSTPGLTSVFLVKRVLEEPAGGTRGVVRDRSPWVTSAHLDRSERTQSSSKGSIGSSPALLRLVRLQNLGARNCLQRWWLGTWFRP